MASHELCVPVRSIAITKNKYCLAANTDSFEGRNVFPVTYTNYTGRESLWYFHDLIYVTNPFLSSD